MDQRQTPSAGAFMARRLAEMDADKAKEAAPEHHYHGKNRAELDHHFECFCCIAFKAQQMPDDYHVPRTGDGKKLGKPLNDTKNGRHQQGVHIAHQINP